MDLAARPRPVPSSPTSAAAVSCAPPSVSHNLASSNPARSTATCPFGAHGLPVMNSAEAVFKNEPERSKPLHSTAVFLATLSKLNRTATLTRAPSTVFTDGTTGLPAPRPAAAASNLVLTRSTLMPATVVTNAPTRKPALATPRPAPSTASSPNGLPGVSAPRPANLAPRSTPSPRLLLPATVVRHVVLSKHLPAATLSNAPSTANTAPGDPTTLVLSHATAAFRRIPVLLPYSPDMVALPALLFSPNVTATLVLAQSIVNTDGTLGLLAPRHVAAAIRSVTTLLSLPISTTVLFAPRPNLACATSRLAPSTARSQVGAGTVPAPRPAALAPRPSLVQSSPLPNLAARRALNSQPTTHATLSAALKNV
jgi:hypothetical protein